MPFGMTPLSPSTILDGIKAKFPGNHTGTRGHKLLGAVPGGTNVAPGEASKPDANDNDIEDAGVAEPEHISKLEAHATEAGVPEPDRRPKSLLSQPSLGAVEEHAVDVAAKGTQEDLPVCNSGGGS